jgi:hypothetical protein
MPANTRSDDASAHYHDQSHTRGYSCTSGVFILLSVWADASDLQCFSRRSGGVAFVE